MQDLHYARCTFGLISTKIMSNQSTMIKLLSTTRAKNINFKKLKLSPHQRAVSFLRDLRPAFRYLKQDFFVVIFLCYRNKLEHSIYWFKYVFCFEIIRSLQSSWLFNRLTFCSKTARFSTSSRTFPSNSIFSLYKLIFHVSTDNVANFTRGQFLCHFGVIKCTTVFCHPIVTFFVFDPV